MVAARKVLPDDVLAALGTILDPDLGRDIVSLGFVKNLAIDGGKVAFEIELTTPACPVKDRMHAAAIEAVRALPQVESVDVQMTARVRPALPTPSAALRGVRNLVAVASGKGGVGKSTVASNLAVALARTGARVGLLDADVYGPSVPTMLGEHGRPSSADGELIRPPERYGVALMSIGLLVDPQSPVIWRGPMASRAVQQLLGQVDWGERDYLLVDLPPGTGDIQLTLAQSVPLSGAVIVTTPQSLAVDITLRGLHMFERVQVPILGMIENMSTFVCSHCGQSTDVFPRGAGERAAHALGAPLLGAIPLDTAIAAAADRGEPVVSDAAIAAGVASAHAFVEIAGRLAQKISIVQESRRADRPQVTAATPKEGALELQWTNGGTSHVSYRALRLACPCAFCVDETTGQRRLDPARVPVDVHPVGPPRLVGRYALQIEWSDGHATGLFDFALLAALG